MKSTCIKVLLGSLFIGMVLCLSSCGAISDTIKIYKEAYRPQFHFTPEAKWMNDPNGMVYYDGEYHLFYQHFPDSTVWGPMHWGHAISKDLVHWEQYPIALYPDSLGYIFSGSAVVDWENTSGFGTKETPSLIAIFTHRHLDGKPKGFESQSLAYSIDKGRTWTKYANNPVLTDPNSLGFRDPKVFWHEDTAKWVMVISAEDKVQLYSSLDLKDWKLESDFGRNIGAHGGVWECPDLFELPVGDTGQTKWVMLVSIGDGGPNGGSSTQYFIGDFDGTNFIPNDGETRWIDYGKDNYAGVTWSDLPDRGKRVFLGWMSNWQYANKVPTHPWRSAMTIPRELKLKPKEGIGYELVTIPVETLSQLQGERTKIAAQPLSHENELVYRKERLDQHQYRLKFERSATEPDGGPKKLLLEWSNDRDEQLLLEYSFETSEFYLDRSKSGIVDFSEAFPVLQNAPYPSWDTLELNILMDWSSIEVFVDGGRLAMTSLQFPKEPYNQFRVVAEGGELTLKHGEISNMESIWKTSTIKMNNNK